MSRSVAYYINKVRQQGLVAIVRGRLRWYRDLMRVKFVRNRTLGRIIELTGNRVRLDGMVFSTDSPLIQPTEKSALFVGLHELDERTLLRRWLPADLPVVEFGGGLGVVSCATNRKLCHRENHIVVEANPAIIPVLERNRDLNGCQFQLVNKALAYDTETIEFDIQPNFLSSRIGRDPARAVSVPTTSLKTIADAAGFDQMSVICDTEGAEATLVERELDTLRQRVRFLLVEIHPGFLGNAAASRLVETLQASGFTLRERAHDNWAFTRA
jgi:FkbM family methyltransferase